MTQADPRLWLGFVFIVGYYAVVFMLGMRGIPPENGDLINNAMLQLGPPVGLIIGALFRSDKTDEQRAMNTGDAFKALRAQAEGKGKPDIELEPGEQRTVSAAPEPD